MKFFLHTNYRYYVFLLWPCPIVVHARGPDHVCFNTAVQTKNDNSRQLILQCTFINTSVLFKIDFTSLLLFICTKFHISVQHRCDSKKKQKQNKTQKCVKESFGTVPNIGRPFYNHIPAVLSIEKSRIGFNPLSPGGSPLTRKIIWHLNIDRVKY